MHIHAHAAFAARDALRQFDYEPEPLGAHDIEIAITHCGICHSDVHLIDNDWKSSLYPLVPGHEIIGTVVARGAEVTRLHEGQRVGVGWQAGACLECEWCVQGLENLCMRQTATCAGRHGGFADRIRLDGRFAFGIPDALDSERAAPLLCGGVTVYAPLRNMGVRPWSRVGVIGIGGLGHMALQFARAFGCEVTAFSTNPAKENEARAFGAHHFVVSSDPEHMRRAAASVDFLLNTVHAPLDWTAFMRTVRPKGTFCFLSGLAGPLNIPTGLLMSGHRTVTGSTIGSRTAIAEMLDFAARHHIGAKTEAMPLSEVNAAVDRVRRNDARYRVVLEM